MECDSNDHGHPEKGHFQHFSTFLTQFPSFFEWKLPSHYSGLRTVQTVLVVLTIMGPVLVPKNIHPISLQPSLSLPHNIKLRTRFLLERDTAVRILIFLMKKLLIHFITA